jgi:hypothetical protein
MDHASVKWYEIEEPHSSPIDSSSWLLSPAAPLKHHSGFTPIAARAIGLAGQQHAAYPGYAWMVTCGPGTNQEKERGSAPGPNLAEGFFRGRTTDYVPGARCWENDACRGFSPLSNVW